MTDFHENAHAASNPVAAARILQLQDESNMARCVEMILKGAGFGTVDSVYLAEEAFEVVDDRDYHLVIIDNSLCDLSWPRAMTRIARSARHDCGAILMSSGSIDDDALIFFEIGRRGATLSADAVLAMPFETELLTAVVRWSVIETLRRRAVGSTSSPTAAASPPSDFLGRLQCYAGRTRH